MTTYQRLAGFLGIVLIALTMWENWQPEIKALT